MASVCEVKRMTLDEQINELKSWLTKNGIQDAVIDLSGQIQRFGKNNKHWLVCHTFEINSKPIISAIAGTWGTESETKGIKFTAMKLNREEAATLREKMKVEENKLLESKENQYKIAAGTATKLIAQSKDASLTHSYLTKKKIDNADTIRQSGDNLIVPIYNIQNQIQGLQTITPEGEKRFLEGSRMSAGFHQIGEVKDTIVICEGYATGWSIWRTTGHAVFCAMNAGNIPKVANVVVKKYPHASIIIGADNDSAGKMWAQLAVKEIKKGTIELPPNDFNDFSDAYVAGTEIVLRQRESEFIDYHTPLPDTVLRNNKITNLPTLNNLREIIRRTGAVVRFNCIKQDEEIFIKGKSFSMDLKRKAAFAMLRNECVLFNVSKATVDDNIDVVADENMYNPVKVFIESEPWDGVSRLESLYATLKSPWDNTELGEFKKTLIRKWLTGAVKAAYSPDGLATQGMLVFQGEQGKGKSTWVRKLAPPHLDIVKTEGAIHTNDKDKLLECLRYWIYEVAELSATFGKSDINSLKAYLTSSMNEIRKPYGHKENIIPRRTVYIGTVNEEEFLHDTTGNRRFWVIPIDAIDYMHTINMQQMWAEVLARMNSEKWEHWLTPEETAMLFECNKAFEAKSGLDLLVEELPWAVDRGSWREYSQIEVFKALGYDPTKITKSEAIRLGVALKKQGAVVRKTKYGQKYLMPKIPDTQNPFA